MRQKTKNYQNQEPTDKKIKFFSQFLIHLPRWVHVVQKTRAKNSHAWAPLNNTSHWEYTFWVNVPIIKQFFWKRWKNSGRAFAEFLQMQIEVIWHKFAMLIKKPLKTAEIDSELKQ